MKDVILTLLENIRKKTNRFNISYKIRFYSIWVQGRVYYILSSNKKSKNFSFLSFYRKLWIKSVFIISNLIY